MVKLHILFVQNLGDVSRLCHRWFSPRWGTQKEKRHTPYVVCFPVLSFSMVYVLCYYDGHVNGHLSGCIQTRLGIVLLRLLVHFDNYAGGVRLCCLWISCSQISALVRLFHYLNESHTNRLYAQVRIQRGLLPEIDARVLHMGCSLVVHTYLEFRHLTILQALCG